MNEEAVTISPLRGTGDFASVPEQIGLFVAFETLAGQYTPGGSRYFGRHVELCERVANPFVNAAVTFARGQFMPRVTRWENQAVSPEIGRASCRERVYVLV